MKEPYGEGVAICSDPESCVVVREDGGEALTGARAGRVWSREIVESLWGADAVAGRGRPHSTHRHREARRDPTRSETPSTYGIISRGNREISGPPASEGDAGRAGKAKAASR